MTKKNMIKYILSFDCYPTMNSWNGSYEYSINAKVHSLPLRKHEQDKIYEMISDDNLSSEFYSRLEDDIENWRWENKDLLGVFTEEKYWEGRGWLNLAVKEERKEALKTIKAILGHKLTQESREKFETALKNNQNVYGAFKEYREQVRFTAGLNGRSAGHLVLYKWNGHNFGGSGWSHNEDELKEMSKEDVRYIYKVLKSFEKLFKTLVDTARSMAGEEVEEVEYTKTKTKKRFKNIS